MYRNDDYLFMTINGLPLGTEIKVVTNKAKKKNHLDGAPIVHPTTNGPSALMFTYTYRCASAYQFMMPFMTGDEGLHFTMFLNCKGYEAFKFEGTFMRTDMIMNTPMIPVEEEDTEPMVAEEGWMSKVLEL